MQKKMQNTDLLLIDHDQEINKNTKCKYLKSLTS